MSTIDKQLAFLSSSAFQSFLNVKSRKKFKKNLRDAPEIPSGRLKFRK